MTQRVKQASAFNDPQETKKMMTNAVTIFDVGWNSVVVRNTGRMYSTSGCTIVYCTRTVCLTFFSLQQILEYSTNTCTSTSTVACSASTTCIQ